MQWLVNFLSRLLCTCGARSLPPSVPPSPPSPLTPSVHDDSPPTSGSKSPPSPSSSVLQEVLSHIPSHASPRSPSPSDNSFLTQLPNDELPPQHTPMVDLPGTRDATPMKAPPPRPPPRLSPNAYQARSSASSSQHALPPLQNSPVNAKAPPLSLTKFTHHKSNAGWGRIGQATRS